MRYWEIDFLRGIAIVMMITFHFFFDLRYFGNYSINLHSGFWWFFARITATIFILLVGISLTLSYSRAKKRKGLYRKYLYRGIKILSWGLIITLITYLFFREGFIIFGILHFIGIAIILAYPFIRMRFLNLFLGILFIIAGIYMAGMSFDFSWLMWLGFMPKHFYTFDYFPILPWFGVALIGLFLGNLLYPNGRKIISDYNSPFVSFFSFLGRHSLLIYLIHQPILVILLYALVL